MKLNYGFDREKGLIEDIVPPKTHGGFNTGQDFVRHQSIGELDIRYRHAHASAASKNAQHTASSAHHSGAVYYTRIPPLHDIDLTVYQNILLAAASKVLQYLKFRGWQLKQYIINSLKPSFVSAYYNSHTYIKQKINTAYSVVPHLFLWPPFWLPKKYTFNKGLLVDWHRTLTKTKWGSVLPILVATIALCTVAVFAPGRNGIKIPDVVQHVMNTPLLQAVTSDNQVTKGTNPSPATNGTTSHAQVPQPTLYGNNPQPNTVSGTSTDSITPPTISDTDTLLPAAGSVASATNLDGGTNTTMPSTTEPSTVMGLPASLTIPPVDVQADNKPVISTTGTGITLN